jgi:hypothetical protein
MWITQKWKNFNQKLNAEGEYLRDEYTLSDNATKEMLPYNI